MKIQKIAGVEIVDGKLPKILDGIDVIVISGCKSLNLKGVEFPKSLKGVDMSDSASIDLSKEFLEQLIELVKSGHEVKLPEVTFYEEGDVESLLDELSNLNNELIERNATSYCNPELYKEQILPGGLTLFNDANFSNFDWPSSEEEDGNKIQIPSARTKNNNGLDQSKIQCHNEPIPPTSITTKANNKRGLENLSPTSDSNKKPRTVSTTSSSSITLG